MRTLLLVLCLSSVAWADAAAVDQALGGVEWHATADRVRVLAPAPDAKLLAAVGDATTTPIRRRRAIALMRMVATPRVRAFLSQRFAELRGARDGSEALELAALLKLSAELHLVTWDDVMPLLQHRTAAVRQSAVAALATLDAERAQKVLIARMPQENDSGVRAEISRRVAQ